MITIVTTKLGKPKKKSTILHEKPNFKSKNLQLLKQRSKNNRTVSKPVTKRIIVKNSLTEVQLQNTLNKKLNQTHPTSLNTHIYTHTQNHVKKLKIAHMNVRTTNLIPAAKTRQVTDTR